ncbi:MAG: DsbA family protein [Caryophanon sp.]|nr:DsbA family protein [Caryophanon sp.]
MTHVQLLTEPVTSSQSLHKPLELYIFIDPLCSSAAEMQATIRKLQVQYEHYFTCRFILSTKLASLNCIEEKTKGCMSGQDVDVKHPVLPSVAVKAAELQGKRAGLRFLTKLQEHLLLKQKNLQSYNTLLKIAEESQLDMQEFRNDFGSKEAAHAFQCDLHITNEMEVDELPTIVFFNECIEDEGLKVSGLYTYDVYEHILSELLNAPLVPSQPPAIEELLTRFHSLSTQEIAAMYDLTEQAAEREMKKRMLQQKVERTQANDVTLWRLKPIHV